MFYSPSTCCCPTCKDTRFYSVISIEKFGPAGIFNLGTLNYLENFFFFNMDVLASFLKIFI